MSVAFLRELVLTNKHYWAFIIVLGVKYLLEKCRYGIESCSRAYIVNNNKGVSAGHRLKDRIRKFQQE